MSTEEWATNPVGGVDAAFLAGVVAANPDPYVVADADGVILWASPTGERIRGGPVDDVIGLNLFDLVAPGSQQAALDGFAELLHHSSAPRAGWVGPPMLLDLLTVDGDVVTCEVRAVPAGVEGFTGLVLSVHPSRVTPLLHDVISAIAGHRAIDEVLAGIIELLGEEMPMAVGVVGRGWDGGGFAWELGSDEAPRVDGWLLPVVEPAAGLPWAAALAGDPPLAESSLDAVAAPVRAAGTAAGFEACWAYPIGPSDVLVVWRRVASPMMAQLRQATDRIVALARLAIESDTSRRSLERAARVDALTGLPNRLVLGEHLAELEREPPLGRLGVIYCDLDDFKPVNDRLGHNVGDQVLAAAATRIVSLVRASDLVVRVGGDEFVVITTPLGDRDEPDGLAERLVAAFREPIPVDGIEVLVGLSVGTSVVDGSALGGLIAGDRLVELADAALLQAKAGGKGRVHRSPFDGVAPAG
ncbi:MAG TPA: diguanylate cyclase [Acidimicrobiales bacterium]|nr:diguanylate cyclase [Acidimicrobiales bacterium]